MNNGNNISKFTFLPWLRQGIAKNINAAITGVGNNRATIPIHLTLKINESELMDPISKNIQVFGPGDIIGINQKAIVKTEPNNWITNFEPNYLAHIEFYDEDFPWRYTPEVAESDDEIHRLRPWVTLVVLKEEDKDKDKEDKEFSNGKDLSGPLPYIELIGEPSVLFPDADQLWAWAHVHVNKDIKGTNTITSLTNLENELNENPDIAYSRLLCPRKLEPNTSYHAFLVPTYESGRLAGLGKDPKTTPNLSHVAWESYPVGTESPEKVDPKKFPYYYRWYFRTGTVGDFEYLVRLLKPRTVDERVGVRDLDIQKPGSGFPNILDPKVLKMGGALKVPGQNLDLAPTDNGLPAFQERLTERINKGLGLYSSDDNPDPIITSPFYGHWHVEARRLTFDEYPENWNWLSELNLDPRHRVSAGLGTRVIQKNQEEYMHDAWKQVENIKETNQKRNQFGMAIMANTKITEKYLAPLSEEDKLFVLAPLFKRVIYNPVTFYKKIKDSALPLAVASPSFRKIVRPQGRLITKINAVNKGETVKPSSLMAKINRGEVSLTPPRPKSENIITTKDLIDWLSPRNVPDLLKNALQKWKWFKYLPLLIILILIGVLLLTGLTVLSVVAIGIPILGLAYLSRQFFQWFRQLEAADLLREENYTAEAIDRLPPNPDFKIGSIGLVETTSRRSLRRVDSPESARFKTALKNQYALFEAINPAHPQRLQLDLTTAATKMMSAIKPSKTMMQRFKSMVYLPGRLKIFEEDPFDEIMVYPEFDIPMYLPLRDISVELLCPNVNYIQQNTITLLETNQKFIEAYMVGLNHEMVRELLWREYPTDKRGSYFRQFWDTAFLVSGEEGNGSADLKEKWKDIQPIHHWLEESKLGDHNNRDAEGDETQIVLVIRGELLKKYPNAIIYAHRGVWAEKEEGGIDYSEPRKLVQLEGGELENPPSDKVRFPLYGAKVEPDISFLGFDLTLEEAKGEQDTEGEPDPGWFFIIEEQPGEPRFGLDAGNEDEIGIGEEESSTLSISSWSDLSWSQVNTNERGYLILDQTISIGSVSGEDTIDDRGIVNWNEKSNAADLAHILYQSPMRVAVHAQVMLKSLKQQG